MVSRVQLRSHIGWMSQLEHKHLSLNIYDIRWIKITEKQSVGGKSWVEGKWLMQLNILWTQITVKIFNVLRFCIIKYTLLPMLIYSNKTWMWNKWHRFRVQLIQMDYLRGILCVRRTNKMNERYGRTGVLWRNSWSEWIKVV